MSAARRVQCTALEEEDRSVPALGGRGSGGWAGTGGGQAAWVRHVGWESDSECECVRVSVSVSVCVSDWVGMGVSMCVGQCEK